MKLKELKDIIREIVKEEINIALASTKTSTARVQEVAVSNKPVIKTGNAELDKIFSTTKGLNEVYHAPVELSSPIDVIGNQTSNTPESDVMSTLFKKDLKAILKASVKRSQDKNGPL